MVKDNYSAWRVNPQEFSASWLDEQKLKFFATYAVLAPSGHNTQPWRLTFDKQTLLLRADYGRRLPYSGVQANEPYVSLGAFLGTLQLAARGFGYAISIKYILEKDKTVMASVKLAGKIPPDPTLLAAIVHRVSNRTHYDTEALSDSLIENFTHTDLGSVSTQAISNRDDIIYIADLTTQATLTTFADKEFRAELSKWVRNNVTKQRDGMPGFVQGIPTPPSIFAKHIIKHMNISKDQARKDSSRVLHSGSLVVITIDNPSEAALMNGGRLYAQICVLAQQHNISTAGVGAAIIDPDTTQKMIKKFKLPGKPVAIIRLGKTDKRAKHTPRWPLSSVTE